MHIPVLDNLSIQQLVWLIPLFFAVHNAEEAPQMAHWTSRLPPGTHPKVTTHQFTIAVVLLTLLTVAVAGAVYVAPHSAAILYALVIVQSAIFINALVPHLLTTVRFRIYSPGLVSGLLINVPFSLYFFYRLRMNQIFGWTHLVIAMALAPLVMVLLAWGALKLSAKVLELVR